MSRCAALVLGVLAAASLSVHAQEGTPSQPVFRFLHDAKVVCGRAGAHHGPLPSGRYATAVNIFNPHSAPLQIELRLSLAHPPGRLMGGEAVPLDPVELPGGKALAVDCRTLRALAFGYGFPASLIEGVLTADALQPLVVSAVWTTAAPAGRHGQGGLTSLDADAVPPRPVEIPPRDPQWSDDGTAEDLCDTLRRTSAIISGTAGAQSYTFDESPGEGPREVTRIDPVTVHAGAGGVVGGPVEIRLSRGLFPDGRFTDTSEMPVLTVGERYLLLLPNHGWVIEPVSLDDVFRIETVGIREILVDQSGFAVTDTAGGRSTEQVSTPERLFRTPEPTGAAIPDEALSPEDYAAAAKEAAEECEGEVLAGPFTAFPLLQPAVTGAE